MCPSFSFGKLKRSPAKSPAGGKGSPAGPQRDGTDSQNASRESSPRASDGTVRGDNSPACGDAGSPRLLGIRTQDDGAAVRANPSFRQPSFKPGSSVLDPVEARARAQATQRAQAGGVGGQAAEMLGGKSRSEPGGGSGGADGQAAAVAAAPAAPERAFILRFGQSFEGAAGAAERVLSSRATARGEPLSAQIEKADFVAAVEVMAEKLLLPLSQPQIEQLFFTVSGGARWVQFDDFIESTSTRQYLMQLAFVGGLDA